MFFQEDTLGPMTELPPLPFPVLTPKVESCCGPVSQLHGQGPGLYHLQNPSGQAPCGCILFLSGGGRRVGANLRNAAAGYL